MLHLLPYKMLSTFVSKILAQITKLPPILYPEAFSEKLACHLLVLSSHLLLKMLEFIGPAHRKENNKAFEQSAQISNK